MRFASSSLILVLLASSTVEAGDKPSDTEIVKKLVGKWSTCQTDDSSTSANGTICYETNNTFVAVGKVSVIKGECVDVHVEGKWKVEDGAVMFTVIKSSHPGIAPINSEFKETVISIDDKFLRIRRGIGKERERTRVEK